MGQEREELRVLERSRPLRRIAELPLDGLHSEKERRVRRDVLRVVVTEEAPNVTDVAHDRAVRHPSIATGAGVGLPFGAGAAYRQPAGVGDDLS